MATNIVEERGGRGTESVRATLTFLEAAGDGPPVERRRTLRASWPDAEPIARGLYEGGAVTVCGTWQGRVLKARRLG